MLSQLQLEKDNPLSDDEMFDMIQMYGPSQLLVFLEYIVLEQKTEDPSKHDALAQKYIETLNELLSENVDQPSEQCKYINDMDMTIELNLF
jgi:hypothetical protein